MLRWRGSSSGTELSWVNMRVPNGNDYLEFMLYSKPPNSQQLGVKNHICLFVPAVRKAVAILESRPAFKNYGRPITINVGKNGKRQANLFDPDGTRIELMAKHCRWQNGPLIHRAATWRVRRNGTTSSGILCNLLSLKITSGRFRNSLH